jgi:membrane-bound lytic murein transglycosylase B
MCEAHVFGTPIQDKCVRHSRLYVYAQHPLAAAHLFMLETTTHAWEHQATHVLPHSVPCATLATGRAVRQPSRQPVGRADRGAGAAGTATYQDTGVGQAASRRCACVWRDVLVGVSLGLAAHAWAADAPPAAALDTANPAAANPTPSNAATAQASAAAPSLLLRTERTAGTGDYGSRGDAADFANEWAGDNSVPAEQVRAVIGAAQRLDKVIQLVTPAPKTFKKDWRAYRARFVEPVRLRAGRAFWDTHADALARAEATYGVPAWLIVGVIGVESLYGQHKGDFSTLDVLTTLAFDFPKAHPKWQTRQAFFRDELGAFLQLASDEAQPVESWMGSYAGALGWPQFMPSSWQQYAVDFDGDGHIDLLHNPTDVIGSVANYFVSFGWQSGMPTHYSVRVNHKHPALPKLLEPDIVPSFSAKHLHTNGAKLGSDALRHKGDLALVMLENAKGRPTYVAGTQNFYVVTRYNWSSYYALGVIELGQAVQEQRRERQASAR